MRPILVAILAFSIAAPFAGPADAQISLPRKSRAERRVDDLNRNLQQEQRLQGVEQQIQIDNNRLRQRIDRDRLFSAPAPTPRLGPCVRGSAGC